jgi:phage tail sheath protein FI
MAEILLSPGVLSREIDTTFIAEQPPAIGAAIIGPTVKGPVGVPVTVTSYTDFTNRFGEIEVVAGSGSYSYFTSIAVYNYFLNGGQSLLVTRVVSGSYNTASAAIIGSGSTGTVFTLATISEGINMNTGTSVDTNNAFNTLNSASIHSVRFQIVSPNTTTGTFNLYVRRGDDDDRNPAILETYTGLSMDPLSENYVARRIGDYSFKQVNLDGEASLQITGTYPNKSRYIRVVSVAKPTPQYLVGGVAVTAYTASIPVVSGSNVIGAFNGGTGSLVAGAAFYDQITSGNIQGTNANNYTASIQLLASANDYQFNVLSIPGLNYAEHQATMSLALSNTEDRGDSVFVMDLGPYAASASQVITTAATVDSSYGAAYYPWVQTLDPATKQYVFCPPSVMIPGVFAYNDSVAEPWFAPAGISRGGLGTVIRAASKLSQGVRDSLYVGKVNPIATFPGQGVVVYGNKTLQTKASALDRINVRRLMIALKRQIGQIANGLVFEQNNASTRNSFLAQVNPYLESVQQRQGLYAFKVVMDDAINNAAVIDRNELVGQIYLQPTKTAEFIYLNFTLTPTGATFE